MTAKAAIEIRDTIRVWIEMRAPTKGELTWAVPIESTPEQALDHVMIGRDVWSAGEAGFGYHLRDAADLDFINEELGMRHIVVHVEHVRTEPELFNAAAHIKLL